MRSLVWVLALVTGFGGVALGQEKLSYEELEKRYDDAKKQLDMAQSRKNELSRENEELKTKLGDAGKQSADLRARLEALEKQAGGWAERTFFLRNHYAAWQQYIRRYPKLWAHWEIFLEGRDLGTVGDVDTFFGTTPAPVGPVTLPAATTKPATRPAMGATTRPG